MSFFGSSRPINDIESAVDSKLESLESLAERQRGEGRSISITENFPDTFRKKMSSITVGDVSWEEFFTDPDKETYAVKCQMDAGSAIQQHCYGNANAYIYLVQGRLINWNKGAYDGDVIVPADEVTEVVNLAHEVNVEGWYQIPKLKTHWMQAVTQSHFVLKFRIDED